MHRDDYLLAETLRDGCKGIAAVSEKLRIQKGLPSKRDECNSDVPGVRELRSSMSEPPIWIVKDKLNFKDLIDREDHYISGWACIIENWLLEPAQHLGGNGNRVTDRGISMLMLLLSFFEPLGSILSGKDSDGASKSTFVSGFEYFSQWLKQRGSDFEIDAAIVFSFARCGLMHSFTMQGGQIFIDAFGVGKTSMGKRDFAMKHTTKKPAGVSESSCIYLIDPWRLLVEVKDFCGDFCKKLESSKEDGTELYANFKKTFERTIVDPGKVYLSK